MFGPAWDEGCGLYRFRKRPGDLAMLNARDTTFVLISRAPLEKLERQGTPGMELALGLIQRLQL